MASTQLMNAIHPYTLWIGTSGDLRDWRRLYEVGVRSVIQVAYEEPLASLPHDLVICRFPLIDGEDNAAEILEMAVATVTHLLEKKFGCLVCCQAGQSRSPGIAAAAIARLSNKGFDFGCEVVAREHPCAIHPGLRTQLQAMACT